MKIFDKLFSSSSCGLVGYIMKFYDCEILQKIGNFNPGDQVSTISVDLSSGLCYIHKLDDDEPSIFNVCLNLEVCKWKS